MRRQDIKYLGLGFAVGGAFAAIVLGKTFFPQMEDFVTQVSAAALNSPTALPGNAFNTGSGQSQATAVALLPTATFTITPSLIPFPTVALPATATLTAAEALISSGGLQFNGPLSHEQQIRLYDASLAFIAPTEKESRQMAAWINMQPYSDPNATCGPLSIAILQRADILSPSIVPHDFFLINPDLGKDRLTLQTAFPKDKYSDTRYKVKINQFDWRSSPLMPGDFLYLYAGAQGNFEHMLVVNRVDSAGRAYSVTNYDTVKGFIIDEVLLYDPADAHVGMFAQWTHGEKQTLGSTGFGGFEVWRLSDPAQ